MKVWLEFFKERLPLPMLLILSLGFTGTSQSLATGTFRPWSFSIGVVLSLLFFLVMRVMDEVKDFDKDKIAHPERPLPRGLIGLDQAQKLVRMGLFLLFAMDLLLFMTGFKLASALFLFTIIYLFFMYKEFYASEFLDRQLILYLTSHQSVLIFLSASLIALSPDWSGQAADLVKPGVLILGTFFIYEIARKLDPAAHPVLNTYRIRFGIPKTGLLMVTGAALILLGLWLNQAPLQAWTIALAVAPLALCLAYPFLVLSRFKILEGIAALVLLTNLWVPFLWVLF